MTSPDNLTPSQPGRGTPNDKTQHTEAVRHRRAANSADIPQEEDRPVTRREAQRAVHAIPDAEDDIPGATRPLERHHNRPERDKSGGNFNGPDKR